MSPDKQLQREIDRINRSRCPHTDSPLGPLQRCQRQAGHTGSHDYGNAAARGPKVSDL